VATARLTATLSMAVRAVTSAAERPGFAAKTAMTRHSGIERPKLAKYAAAIAELTVLDRTDSR
jgi:hypothetical protein